ncbi:hypothetical protein SAMN06295955_10863 [Sphingopyxis indica]|uniref:Uncharacterized protein n=1 Tax=Sphingopyxis indica TaxID=436663 RepID=A0A239IQI8_9SPHN|nr:hypothetical protein SAMN06295955_10863 [Sphingopyxis indica]
MRDLGNDGAKSTMPQPFLHTGENGLVVAGLHIDHPIRGKTRLGERWREQIRPGHAPKNLAFAACGYSCRKERCRRAINRAIAATGDLVKRTDG